MPIATLLIHGPTASGKSTVARLIADQVLEQPPHYIRMVPARDGYTNAVLRLDEGKTPPVQVGAAWASVHRIFYTGDRVFEILPEGVRVIRKLDRMAFVIIEADSDPVLRHAYPYDYRLFVMPAPDDLTTVFRPRQAAAAAMQQVMQDTAAFASEIFGLVDAVGLDDTVGVQHYQTREKTSGEMIEKLEVGETQMKQFMNSPLGVEIVARIQLQPEYHALVEADAVLINTGLGEGAALDACLKRLEKLLTCIRHGARRRSVLYWGDLSNAGDASSQKLIVRLQTLLAR